MKVLISTDTSCLINYDLLPKHGISVFPLNVIVDGEEFLDGITINQEQLRNAMISNKKVQTSTPPLGQVTSYFEGLFAKGYDHIIHFTISSKLSSMYQLFSSVSEQFAGKVTIIDGMSISSLMLSHILFAFDEANKGTSVDKIVSLIEERKKNNKAIFFLENLKALKNGGRISPAIAALGNTLGLKPVIGLKDGALVKECMTRNIKKSFFDSIKSMVKDYPVSDYDYTLIDFYGNEKLVAAVNEYLSSFLGDYNVIRGIIPINVCAHCGPGTVGIVVSPRINKKSINEYL